MLSHIHLIKNDSFVFFLKKIIEEGRVQLLILYDFYNKHSPKIPVIIGDHGVF